MTSQRIGGILLIGSALLLLLGGGKGCDWTPTPEKPPVVVPVVKPTAVTYVYEKDSNPIPSPVLVALNTLNRTGLLATVFEQNTIDGTGETPEQYKTALAAAKAAGLPALVVQAGKDVIRTVKAPATAESVLEAAK